MPVRSSLALSIYVIMSRGCNNQDIFLSKEERRGAPVSSSRSSGGAGGSLRGWGGDNERSDYSKGRGGPSWEDAFAEGYAAAMTKGSGRGKEDRRAPARGGRSRSPRGGRKGNGKQNEDEFANFGSRRYNKGDDRKGGDRDRGGKGKRKGKGRSSDRDAPVDAGKLDDALDSYFGKEPVKRNEAKKEGRGGKGKGKVTKTAEEMDNDLNSYFGKEKEDDGDKKQAAADEKKDEKAEEKPEEKKE